MKIRNGLKAQKQKALSLHNLICYTQLAIAHRFNLEEASCIVTEGHFFQGRFPARRTTQERTWKDRDFEDELIDEDIIFHYKHIYEVPGGIKEKGVDVWFALESYELAQYRDFDFVVLITGDADHEMLARKIKSLKKHVVLLTWNFDDNDSTSPALEEECTFHIDINKLVDEKESFMDLLTGERRSLFQMAVDPNLMYMD